MTKQEQREEVKEVLSELSDEVLNEQSITASRNLIDMPEFASAKTILAYNAMKRECDPRSVVAAAKKAGKTVAFPLCSTGNTITVCVPHDESAFVVGAYGIIEPDITKSDVLAPTDLDLIIVPGLAFDRFRHRLGRGAGYYDRLLAQSPAFKIGFCFDHQLVISVVTEEHDVQLDALATPSGIYRP